MMGSTQVTADTRAPRGDGLCYDAAVAELLRPDTVDFACKGGDGLWHLRSTPPQRGTGPFLERGPAEEIHLCINDGSGAYFQVLCA